MKHERVITLSTVIEIINSEAFIRTIKRMAHEIVEKNDDIETLALVGVYRRGASLADMLAEVICSITGTKIPVGYLDITSYRDDINRTEAKKEQNKSKIDFSVDGKTIVLVDDVIYTGRTARAAMEAIIDMGRPKKIRLAAMVDRGHRELPIRPDYVGKNVPTSSEEKINVLVYEYDGENRVCLEK